MQHKLSTSLVLLSLICLNDALRILVCFPMISKSHSILGHGVVNQLLEAGHEVVHLTSYPKEKPVANLTEIDVSSMGADFQKQMAEDDSFKLKNLINQDNFGDTLFFTYFTYLIHKKFLEQSNVVQLLTNPNEKFDAVVLEWFFSELNAGIPPLLQCPTIWVCSTEPHWQALRLMDEVPNPAYSTDLFSPYKLPLTFWQRVQGLWKVVRKTIILDLVVSQVEKWTYNQIYTELASKRGVEIPSYTDAVYNGSLMFVNSHPSLGGALKLPQNVISVGGYHIDRKVKPLPQDLQKLMDEAKHGVIYFSMGSNLKSEGMSENMKKSLLDMFSKYKQTVIWKFESDMTEIPSNVHLVKWAPQPSILAHPNLKVFITHGGQLSTAESIHFGVPVVGVPVMADQHINMRAVEQKGFGIKVQLSEEMYPELDAAVRSILTNETYKNNAKELSSIFHDRTIPPGPAIPFWVEHVVRTRGAPHLRSPALHVPLYQRLYLDLALCITIGVILLKKAIKYLQKKRSDKTKSKLEKNKKKK